MTIYLEPWRRLAFGALPVPLDAAGKGVVLLAAAGAVVLAFRKRFAVARQALRLPAGLDGRHNRRALARRGAFVALVAIAALAMPTACSKAPQKAQFKDATITLYMDLQSGKYVPDSKQATVLKVTDPKQLEALLAFFPEMDRGKESWRAAGWEAGVEIKFVKRDGKTIRVAAPPELEVWSEGHGDWPVNGDLKAFLLDLQKEQPATQPAPSASPGQATATAPDRASTQPAEMVITPGVGVGPVTLGMSREEVIKHLGKPVKIEGEGGYGLNYISSLGLSVLVSPRKGVVSISCWTSRVMYWLSALGMKDFRGATDKGIKMGAGRDEIVRAYGRADSESGGAPLYMDYRSEGIKFILCSGKLAKIEVVEPDVFALIPSAAFSQPAATTQPATQPATQPGG